jgi:protein involved in polysaccharide export with SLBB domain
MKHRRHLVFYSALFGLLLIGTVPAAAAIHSGDSLTIHVYNHPELSSDTTPVKVDSRGQVTVPVAGTITVRGLEPKAVAKLIAARLAKFVPYPAVDVADTSETAVIFVAGGPGGVVPYSPGETLATAIADVEKDLQRAQTGTTVTTTNLTDALDRSRVDTKRVVVERDGKVFGTYNMLALRKAGDPGPDLYPDDTISFADKPVEVTILGDVAIPGKAYLWDDEPLNDAVSQAGGLKDTAASGRIELTRDGSPGKLIAAGDPAFFAPAHQNDVVVFPTAPRVTVAGMVYTPGVTTLKNNFTLLSAMYSAGGIQKWANLKDVQVTHDGTTTHYDITKLTHGDATQNPPLHDGDLVFVPEGHRIDFTAFWTVLFGAGNLAHDVL